MRKAEGEAAGLTQRLPILRRVRGGVDDLRRAIVTVPQDKSVKRYQDQPNR